MEQTNLLLLMLVCVAVVTSQRRRDRTRINYDDSLPSSSSSYETESFFPDIDWSDPFTDVSMGAIPEWGFKKTSSVSDTPADNIETVSSSQSLADRDGASRRLEVDNRVYRRTNTGSARKTSAGSRHFSSSQGFDNYNRYDERYKAMASRSRTRDRFRPKVEQQNFNIPSNIDTPNPLNLRVNSMRVSSVRDEVNLGSGGGGLAMGLFGGGDIGGAREESESSSGPARSVRVTTYRPSNFLPVTTYRPQSFQPLTDSWARSVNRKNNLPSKEIKIRDFVDNLYKVEAPIRPARWKPTTSESSREADTMGSTSGSTSGSTMGSPYFILDKNNFQEDEPPVKRPSVFLPTLSSIEVEPSSQSILSFDPEFIKEEEETIENVFIPTMGSVSTTETDNARFSTSAARDAERRADQAYNQKKLQENDEEKQESLSTKTGPSDADNLRKWKKEMFLGKQSQADRQGNENAFEEVTTPKFQIDREFMQDRRRPATSTTTTRPAESERPSYNYLPTMKPLDNLQQGNAYAKTHLRNQKIKVDSNKAGDELDHFHRAEPTPLELLPEEKLEGTKLISENGNNFGKTFFQSLKTRDGGKVDYMHLKMRDITKVIPINKLSSLLKKHGYTPSDIFNKNEKALEIAGKAMKNKNYFEEDFETKSVLSQSTTNSPRFEEEEKEEEFDDENPYEGLNIDIVQWDDVKDQISNDDNDNGFKSRIDNGIKMPWPKRPKSKPEISNGIKMPWPQRANIEKENIDTNDGRRNNKAEKPSWSSKDRHTEERITSRKESPRKINLATRKEKNSFVDKENDVIPAYRKIDEEIEKEASSMDFKSLVKKISPMSLSEVLTNVGYSLQDIMRGNKKAIKEVLKFHKKSLNPDAYKVLPTKQSTDQGAKNEESFEEFVRTESEVVDTTIENLPPSSTSTTTTTTTTVQSNAVPAIDLFKKCKACSRFFKTLRSSTTSTTSQPLKFGERTSKDTPTNIKQMKKRQRQKPTVPDLLSKRLDDDDEQEGEEENENTTTPFSSLNFTLANLNMSENEVMEKKELKVPGLDQLFGSLTKTEDKSEIIYGEKKQKEEKETTQKAERTEPTKRKESPKVYKNTDPFFNNGGGVRIRWNNQNSYGSKPGGFYGGGGGRLITNRKTTMKTTTRIPITYFGLEDELESSNPNDFLNGDYNGVNYNYDYEAYDYYGPSQEVPSGVKSALIASSVVGGLAVSIFLCIFMLCLWKQMKSKLRMAGEYEDRSQGFLSSVFFKKSKKDIKKETNGYFNKVSPIGEQHYSTTSSEEY